MSFRWLDDVFGESALHEEELKRLRAWYEAFKETKDHPILSVRLPWSEVDPYAKLSEDNNDSGP